MVLFWSLKPSSRILISRLESEGGEKLENEEDKWIQLMDSYIVSFIKSEINERINNLFEKTELTHTNKIWKFRSGSHWRDVKEDVKPCGTAKYQTNYLCFVNLCENSTPMYFLWFKYQRLTEVSKQLRNFWTARFFQWVWKLIWFSEWTVCLFNQNQRKRRLSTYDWLLTQSHKT